MTYQEYEKIQELSWMYETSDDVLADCFAGDIDLDSPSYSHSFDSTELEERLLREHKKVMDRLRNLPKRERLRIYQMTCHSNVLFDCFNGDIDLDPTDGDIELEKILEGEYSLIP